MQSANCSIILGLQNNQILHKKTLIHIFNNSVKQFPNRIALSFNDEVITYLELDQGSNAFARKLHNLNIGKGTVIGLFLPRGFDLFIAHLGILKAGATYIPFDVETPIERVAVILKEANAAFCVSNLKIDKQITSISLDEYEALSNSPIDFSDIDSNSHIIFTSGSTGKPKGIPIKHYQIAHFIESENEILNITCNDIVYQGFSISFDMWFEEVWISFLVGATLIVADNIISKSFDKLEDFIKDKNITVLHAVPSLLGFIGNNVPSLRLINSGGEACNENVIRKWAKDNIQFFNSYGPTETTVTATIGQLQITDLVNVGFPLPNYSIAIINDEQIPVELGEIGELVVSGIGVSEGYFNNQELTTKSFINKPISLDQMYGDKIYLTGDLGFINDDGKVVVLGRKDDQVKIRGYRVELGEIESVINSIDQVLNAVVVKKHVLGIDQLIAYYETTESMDLSDILKNKIHNILPVYMLPSQFIKVNNFNRLASGKIDRKNLPEIQSSSIESKIDEKFSNDSVTQKVLELLIDLFPGQEINTNSDFFDDLGGHSMLAAIFVSESRNKIGINDVSILDIYQKRKIESIIDFWKEKSKNIEHFKSIEFEKPNNLSYYLCGLFQIMGLFIIFGLVAAQIFIPYLSYYIVANEVDGFVYPIISAIISFMITPPIILLIIILIKKSFVGKFTEGDYPLWGYVYFKWWFYKRLVSITPSDTLSNSPLYIHYLRFIGFKISANAQLNKFEFGVGDLIEIGENVTISGNVILNNAYVEYGQLKLRSIIIEDNGYIGTSSVVNGGCIIKENGTLNDLSSLRVDTTIKSNEIWEGSPAIYKESNQNKKSINNKHCDNLYNYKFLFLILILPLIIVLPLIPTIIGLHYLDDNADWYSFYYLFSTPLFSLIYIVLFIAEVVLLTRLFNRKMKEGTYSIFSNTYINKWFSDQLFSLLLLVIKPIFATVYINKIYRLLGAKVGKNTEISNASNVSHHLLEIGNESFIADVAVIGETDIRNQELILKKTIIGDKIFIGNSAVVPQGLNLGNNKLIGVLSIAPSQSKLDQLETDWFGSPAIQLPKRQINANYPDSLTFKPNKLRVIARSIIEFIRILIPQSLILCFSIIFIAYAHDLITKNNSVVALLLFPIYYLLIVALPAFLVTFLLKWIIIGKYKKAEYPMWTIHVWLTEAITSLYESVAVAYFLDFLQGTIFLPFFVRLLGVKVGKKVYLETTDFTEFDLVTIGDYANLNFDSGPQTHLFEDRVMKMGPVKIGSNVTIGAGTIILYDSIIGKNTVINPLSLVMKGDEVPSNSIWGGIPITNR